MPNYASHEEVAAHIAGRWQARAADAAYQFIKDYDGIPTREEVNAHVNAVMPGQTAVITPPPPGATTPEGNPAGCVHAVHCGNPAHPENKVALKVPDTEDLLVLTAHCDDCHAEHLAKRGVCPDETSTMGECIPHEEMDA